MRRDKIKKGKYFYHILTLLSVVLSLIAVAFFILDISKEYNAARNQVMNNADYLLNSTQMLLANYLRSVDSQVIQNAVVMETLDWGDLPVGRNDYLSMKKILNILEYQRAIQISDDIMESTSFYYKKQGLLVTDKGIINRANFSAKELLDFADNLAANTAWYGLSWVPSENYIDDTVPVLSHIRQLPLLASGKKTGIIVDINLIKLSEMLRGLLFLAPGDQVYLVNEQGITLVDVQFEKIGKNLTLYPYIDQTMHKVSGQFFSTYNNDMLLTTYGSEKITGWKIIVINNAETVRLYKITTDKLIFFIPLELSMIFLSFLISSLFYRPLASFIESINGRIPVCGTDEFKMVGVQFAQYVSVSREQNDLLKLSEPILRKNLAYDLLMDSIEPVEHTKDLYKRLGIFIPNGKFYVLAMESPTETFSEDVGNEYVGFAADNFLFLRTCEHWIWMMETDKYGSRRAFVELARYLKETDAATGKKCKIGISHFYSDLSLARKARWEAVHLCKFNVAFNKDIVFYEDLEARIPIQTEEIFAIEKQIKHTLMELGRDECAGCIDNITNRVEESFSAIEDAANFYVLILYGIHRVLHDYDISYESAFNCDYQEEEFRKLTTISEMNLLFKGICLRVYDCINQKRNEKNKGLILDIIKYINQQIHDPDMSLSTVADRMFFSVPYLSRMFKDYVGVGFVEYVHDRRIEMAKELLVGTDLTVYEIADKIGMSNQTINRVFKQNEGVTPGQYRSQFKANNFEDI